MMRRSTSSLVAVGGLLLVSGCRPNLAAVSSGHVGCPASEITITDDFEGIGQRTWVAECRGTRYFCSAYQVTNQSGQASCKAEGGETTASSAPQSAPAFVPPPTAPAVPPPAAAAGFSFGATVEASQQACTGAEHEFTPGEADHFRCSGTVADVGIQSDVLLRFCEQKLCAIMLKHGPNKKTAVDDFTAVRNALGTKYGRAQVEQTSIPQECRSSYWQCLTDEKMSLVYEWTWPTGERIKLSMGKGEGEGEEVAIRLQYVRKPHLRPRAEGL